MRKLKRNKQFRIISFLMMMIIIISCKPKSSLEILEYLPIINNFSDISNALGKDSSRRILDKVISKSLYLNNADSLLTGWAIPQDNAILNLMKTMDTISHYELNKCYSNFHCGIQGELIYEDIRYDYNLNSGGWLQLKNAKGNIVLGFKDQSDIPADLFVSVKHCNDEWDQKIYNLLKNAKAKAITQSQSNETFNAN